jgi:hypothetical protein
MLFNKITTPCQKTLPYIEGKSKCNQQIKR